MSDPTVAHRDPTTSYDAYEQWRAARKCDRLAAQPERPWKVTISRERTRTVYVAASRAGGE
jgi:hypothetical protein